MSVILEKKPSTRREGDAHRAVTLPALRIAISAPELEPLQRAMSGAPADATYLIQRHIATRLKAQGHKLTFITQRIHGHFVVTSDLQHPLPAPQTWSKSRWFDLLSKAVWRVQQWLHVPYLNLFANYKLFDACLQSLPGHDLVYERNGLYRSGVAMACKRLRLPYVLFVEADEILEHDFLGQPIRGILRWRAKQMFRYNLKSADYIVCVSEALKAHLVAAWGLPAEKILVFPNGVDVHRFQPDQQARAVARAELGVDANPLVIFVGNFYKWHDIETLLDAFAQTLVVQPAARLMLVGDGAQRQAMIEYANYLGISHATQFVGLVAHEKVPGLLNAADIAVAPVPKMTQQMWLSPLKVFEYMASGTAVVASAVGQVAEVVHDGDNGLLVPPGDSSALAAALQKLIAEPNLRTRLSRQARADAVQKHSWERYIARLQGVFVAALKDRPVAPSSTTTG